MTFSEIRHAVAGRLRSGLDKARAAGRAVAALFVWICQLVSAKTGAFVSGIASRITSIAQLPIEWYQAWRRKERARQARAKRRQKFAQELKQQMGAKQATDDDLLDDTARARAALETSEAAEEAASAAMPDGPLVEEPVPAEPGADPDVPRPEPEEEESGVPLKAVDNPFADRDKENRKRHKARLKRFNDPGDVDLTDYGRETAITTTEDEMLDAEMMTDATIIPPPHRSEKKHTDLTVRGYWATNPNATEAIQEASRLPIVNRQISKTIEHLTTSGIKLAGPERFSDIIRRWFTLEMEYSTGFEKGKNRFVEDLAEQMLRFGSAAVVKQRSRSGKAGSYDDPMTGGTRNGVHSYMVPDMATVQCFIDKKGRPRKWRQDPSLWTGKHEAKEYKARDVFVARLPMRSSSMYFWTPSLVMPVVYAIEVLSDLHETIESHTNNIIDIPSYAQVGSKDYLDGKVQPSMLDQVAQTIRSTSRGQMLIMPFYVELEKHESDEYIEQLLEAANFWETVIRRGVGGNQFDDGEGGTSNRNTADVLEEKGMRMAQSLVPEIKRAARWLFIDKLLEEGVSMDEIADEGMVELEFEDIDLADQMAREGHSIFKWQNDAMTHEQLCKELGYDVDPDRQDMYYSDIQKEVQKEVDKAKNEAQSRTRPNGDPKPKRKNDRDTRHQADDQPIV